MRSLHARFNIRCIYSNVWQVIPNPNKKNSRATYKLLSTAQSGKFGYEKLKDQSLTAHHVAISVMIYEKLRDHNVNHIFKHTCSGTTITPLLHMLTD
jgi:hypothetical protein